MGASCKSPFELYTRIFVIYPPAAVLPSLSGIVIFMDFSESVSYTHLQDVMVAHLSNGSSRGVVMGTIWNRKYAPVETGAGLYRKDLSRKKDAAYVLSLIHI